MALLVKGEDVVRQVLTLDAGDGDGCPFFALLHSDFLQLIALADSNIRL